MKHFQYSRTATGIFVEGYPDAVKVIRLTNKIARRAAELWLHKVDLDFAADCLKEIIQISADKRVMREGLWRSAIVHYTKCFGQSKARFQLAAKSIFKADPLALTAHNYIVDLRDKHIVHDENAYAHCFPGAILNRADKAPKIEEIGCFALYVQTLNEQELKKLLLLIDIVHQWVEDEFEKVSEVITKDLEQIPYTELLGRDDLTIQLR